MSRRRKRSHAYRWRRLARKLKRIMEASPFPVVLREGAELHAYNMPGHNLMRQHMIDALSEFMPIKYADLAVTGDTSSLSPEELADLNKYWEVVGLKYHKF